MKKNIFPQDKLLWLVFHGGLFLALGVSLPLLGPVRINASLFDIIPVSGSLKSAAAADAILGERNSRQIVMLSASDDFLTARAGAAELYAALSQSGNYFESLTLWTDESFMDRFRRYLYDYRFVLLDSETVKMLDNGEETVIAANALAAAFSPFTLAPLDNLSGDPFLLVERSMQKILGSSLLSSGNMSLRDNVLAAQHEGRWYVLLRGSLAPKGLALTNRESTVKKIYEAGAYIVAANPDVQFFYSGIPFHSYESSSNAQKEISLISIASLFAVLAIFLYVFRSPIPVLAVFAAIGLSLLTAFTSVMLFFREVHVLSFVFGTTLIGTCVDYSIHFLVHRNALDGIDVRRHIGRGLAICLVSTIICFVSFLFAPFAILKQFAVFSITGLVSSFLTVMCIFPLIRGGKRKNPLRGFRFFININPKMLKQICLFALAGSFSLFVMVLFVNRGKIKVENRLSDLYKMSARLQESERINAQVINYGSSGWYFIVPGADTEEVLQNEEALCAVLDAEIARGNLGSYMAVSSFCPSKKTQRLSYEAAAKLLPLAETQFETLGFPPETAAAYREEFAAAECFLLPTDSGFPPELGANLWIGKSGGKYYSCVLPLHAADEGVFRKIAAENDSVFFVNKVSDAQHELDRLTRIMLFLFFIAFMAIIIMVRRFYSWKQTARIFAVPVFLFLAVLAVLSCLNIPLGFFSIVGLLLVFGLGLDYIFYNCEAENRRENKEYTVLAILVSFVTTAISFGALALSSFAPVHIFGITVFSGLCAAYIFSTLLSVSVVPENQRISGSNSSPEKQSP